MDLTDEEREFIEFLRASSGPYPLPPGPPLQVILGLGARTSVAIHHHGSDDLPIYGTGGNFSQAWKHRKATSFAWKRPPEPEPAEPREPEPMRTLIVNGKVVDQSFERGTVRFRATYQYGGRR